MKNVNMETSQSNRCRPGQGPIGMQLNGLSLMACKEAQRGHRGHSMQMGRRCRYPIK